MLLAYEEAHNYVAREERGTSFARTAVERVAKEGRKYGVSAMLISQRPAELSETVLAQCNSFVAMRLSNPEDQGYVAKVVSDHFTGLIQMLPVLRPGEAFVIGDSVIMPMRTLVDLPRPAPQSGNIDFLGLWADSTPDYDIDEIIDHWRRQDRQHVNELSEQHVTRRDPKAERAADDRLPLTIPPPPEPVGPSGRHLRSRLLRK